MAKDRSVDVTSSSPDFSGLEPDITRALKKALVHMKRGSASVDVALLSEEEMAEINTQYRDKEGPTNVLSFPDPEEMPDGESDHLGEIYLCPDVIKKRDEDIVYLSIHGLLHLLGYTHKSKSDTIEMTQLEEELMKLL